MPEGDTRRERCRATKESGEGLDASPLRPEFPVTLIQTSHHVAQPLCKT